MRIPSPQILCQPDDHQVSWVVRFLSLFLRSRAELMDHHKQDRGLIQLETVVFLISPRVGSPDCFSPVLMIQAEVFVPFEALQLLT